MRLPSYVLPRLRSDALDTLSPARAGASRDLIAIAENKVEDADAPDSASTTLLRDALDAAEGKRDRLRAQIERSFDEELGPRQRLVQAAHPALPLRDRPRRRRRHERRQLAVAERLWRDDALRASVVAAATQAVEEGGQACPGADPEATPQKQVASCVEAVEEPGLPIGWTDRSASEGWAILGKIGGLLATAFALTLGAILVRPSPRRSHGCAGAAAGAAGRAEREADRPAPGERPRGRTTKSIRCLNGRDGTDPSSVAIRAMARTLFDRIWEHHVVAEPHGEPALLWIDLHLVHEVTSLQAFEGSASRAAGAPAGSRRSRRWITTCRRAPGRPTRSRAQLEALERNCAEFGVPLYATGSGREGIVHVIDRSSASHGRGSRSSAATRIPRPTARSARSPSGSALGGRARARDADAHRRRRPARCG